MALPLHSLRFPEYVWLQTGPHGELAARHQAERGSSQSRTPAPPSQLHLALWSAGSQAWGQTMSLSLVPTL